MSGEPLVVVQNNYIVKNTAAVAVYARDRGVPMLDLSLTDEMDFDAGGVDLADHGRILVYGSVGFLKRAASHPVLRESLSWAQDGFMASTWAEAFGDDYVGAGGRLMPAQEVAASLEAGGRLAVRPEGGMKEFKGGVYDAAAWRQQGVHGDVPCFAVTPSKISSECRVWFAASEPVTGVRYMLDRKVTVDDEGVADALKAAERFARRHLPFADVVMDVGLTPDGWKLIEFNCIHSAGWYGTDPAPVLDRFFSAVKPTPAQVGPAGAG